MLTRGWLLPRRPGQELAAWEGLDWSLEYVALASIQYAGSQWKKKHLAGDRTAPRSSPTPKTCTAAGLCYRPSTCLTGTAFDDERMVGRKQREDASWVLVYAAKLNATAEDLRLTFGRSA